MKKIFLFLIPLMFFGCSNQEEIPEIKNGIKTNINSMKLPDGRYAIQTHQTFISQGLIKKDRVWVDTLDNPGTIVDDDGKTVPAEIDLEFALHPNSNFPIPTPIIIIDTVKQ